MATPSSPQRDTDGYGLYALDGTSDFDAASVTGWRKALRSGDQPDAAGFFPLSGAGIRDLDVEVAPNGASPLNPPATLHVYGPAPDTGMPTVSSFPLQTAGTTRLQLRAGDMTGRDNDTGLHFAVTPQSGAATDGPSYGIQIADAFLSPSQRAAARAKAQDGLDLAVQFKPLSSADTDPLLQKPVAYGEPSGTGPSPLHVGGDGDGFGGRIGDDGMNGSAQVSHRDQSVTFKQHATIDGVGTIDTRETISPTGAVTKESAEVSKHILNGNGKIGIKVEANGDHDPSEMLRLSFKL